MCWGEAQTTRSTEALGVWNTNGTQSFASEPKELNRYADKVGDPIPIRGRHDTNNSNTHNSDKHNNEDTTNNGFLYCTLWYGFYLVTIDQTLTLGGLIAFQSYVFIIGAVIGTTVNNVAQVFSGVGASGRVFYLLERQPNIKNYNGIISSGSSDSTCGSNGNDDDDNDDDGDDNKGGDVEEKETAVIIRPPKKKKNLLQ